MKSSTIKGGLIVAAAVATAATAIFIFREFSLWKQVLKERLYFYNQALEYARATGKPLLVVGRPMGMYPCGDYTMDLEPKGECPNEIVADVQDLSQFDDNTFGAVFASHVLEHVEDIETAFQELDRIGEKLFVAYPYHDTLAAHVPLHKWFIYTAPPKTDYLEFRRIPGK